MVNGGVSHFREKNSRKKRENDRRGERENKEKRDRRMRSDLEGSRGLAGGNEGYLGVRKEKERHRRRDAKKKDEEKNARLCRETAVLGGDAVARAKVGSEGGWRWW